MKRSNQQLYDPRMKLMGWNTAHAVVPCLIAAFALAGTACNRRSGEAPLKLEAEPVAVTEKAATQALAQVAQQPPTEATPDAGAPEPGASGEARADDSPATQPPSDGRVAQPTPTPAPTTTTTPNPDESSGRTARTGRAESITIGSRVRQPGSRTETPTGSITEKRVRERTQ